MLARLVRCCSRTQCSLGTSFKTTNNRTACGMDGLLQSRRLEPFRRLFRDGSHTVAVQQAQASEAGTDGTNGSPPTKDENEDLRRLFISKGSRLTNIAHQIWNVVLQPGDIVCDATCGNGNDSIFLAQAIGKEGRLVCIDLQEEAVQATKENIEKTVGINDLPEVEYVTGSHEHLTEYLGSNVAKLICFNLGYLPGGDKSVVTQIESTLTAIEGSLESLCFGGLISLLCYTGHPGGQEEYSGVKQFVEQLCPTYWKVSQIQLLNSPSAPIMILIWKLE